MKIKKLKGRVRLSLEGEMTVNTAAELKDGLIEAVQQSDTIEIDLAGVTEMDLSFLQLMCSAHRTAANRNKVFRIIDPEQSVMLETRKRAGFAFHKSCRFVPTDDCLWLGGLQG